MHTKVEIITPEIAKNYLAFNSKNRNMRKSVVTQYAKDMAAGKWELTHQGIAFNCDGTLLDGQHRLAAVVESNCPVQMMVTRGVDSKTQIVMDDHAKRTAGDAIGLVRGMNINHNQIAIIRCCVETGNGGRFRGRKTRMEIDALLDVFINPLQFIDAVVHKKDRGVTSAPVLAAICLAWFYVDDLSELERFSKILFGLEMPESEHDKSAVILREHMLRNGMQNSSSSIRTEVFKKTQRAILAFMKRERISKLYATDFIYRWPLACEVRS